MKYWRSAKFNDWNGIFYPAVQVADDSCVPVNRYTGIVYYEREGSNKWLMRFNVVQNINVFLQVIKITCILSNHYNFFSILKTITLMLFETRWLGFHSWTQWMDALNWLLTKHRSCLTLDGKSCHTKDLSWYLFFLLPLSNSWRIFWFSWQRKMLICLVHTVLYLHIVWWLFVQI